MVNESSDDKKVKKSFYEKFNKRNKDIFVSKASDIDAKTYILFHKSFVTIDRISEQKDPGQLVTYTLEKDRHGRDELDITMSGKIFAYFYDHYYFNKGIMELLKDDNYDKYRFYITYQNIPNKLKLFVDIYIDKYYLLDLYDEVKVPRLLCLIVSDHDKKWKIDTGKKSSKTKKYQIDTCLNEDEKTLDCEKYLKIKLYNYQRNNVKWMHDIEKRIHMNLTKYNFIDYTNFKEYYIESIKESLYFDNNYKLFDLSKDTKYQHKINLNGGVLCDEVGLGKTLSMVSLILQNPKDGYVYPVKKQRRRRKKKKVNNKIENEDIKGKIVEEIILDDEEEKKKKEEIPKSRATLIICPNRLCRQWTDEISKYLGKFDVKIATLLSITQYKKMSLEDYQNIDIILIGFTFLLNKRYLDEEESKLRLDKIMWHRIIVDEGHELLIDKFLPKKNFRQMKETLYKFDATYKWVCSGTPLGEPLYGYPGILKFISRDFKNEYVSACHDSSTDLIKKYFRYNSKQSIQNEVVIPPVEESVKFLKQTRIEKAIYNSANGNELQQLQLCTHVLVSEYDNILDDELCLDKLQEIMIKYFTEKISKTEKRVSNLEIQINNSEKSYEKKINNFVTSLDDLEKAYNKNVDKINTKINNLHGYHETETAEVNDEITNKESELDSMFDDSDDIEKDRLQTEIDDLKENLDDMETTYNQRLNDFNCKLTELEDDYKENKEELEEQQKALTENYEIKSEENNERLSEYKISLNDYKYKFKVFNELDEKYEELTKEICPITKCEIDEPIVTICGHYFDKDSIEYSLESVGKWCPLCKTPLQSKDVYPVIKNTATKEELTSINMYGTKMAFLIKYLTELITESPDNRIIVFTQWEKMMKLVSRVLTNNDVKHVTIQGNAHVMANRIRRFKVDKDIRIIILSSGHCSSGSNLTEASHIVLLDTLNETKENAKAIEKQAIGRANRIGQNKTVKVKRIIMEDTIEHEYYIRNMN